MSNQEKVITNGRIGKPESVGFRPEFFLRSPHNVVFHIAGIAMALHDPNALHIAFIVSIRIRLEI